MNILLSIQSDVPDLFIVRYHKYFIISIGSQIREYYFNVKGIFLSSILFLNRYVLSVYMYLIVKPIRLDGLIHPESYGI